VIYRSSLQWCERLAVAFTDLYGSIQLETVVSHIDALHMAGQHTVWTK
jgi:hypothetical protein